MRKSTKPHEAAAKAFLADPQALTITFPDVPQTSIVSLMKRLSGHDTFREAGLATIQSGQDVVVVRRAYVPVIERPQPRPRLPLRAAVSQLLDAIDMGLVDPGVGTDVFLADVRSALEASA